MLEVNELTYAAIITVELPGMGHPATVSLTLSPPDVLETAPGQYKPLRECTLADIQAFADAIEAQIWEQYRHTNIDELATATAAHVKITLINEGGKALALSREQVLQHAIQVSGPPRLVPSGELDLGAADAEGAVEDKAPEATEEEIPDAGAAPAQTDVAGEVPDKPLQSEGGKSVSPQTKLAPGSPLPDDDKGKIGEDTDIGEHRPYRREALRIAGLRRPAGHTTPAAVDILVNEPAIRDAQNHALSSMDREVAGMLIGPQPEKQPDGRYVVHVTDIIVARHTRMMGASVTYTPESWRYVTDQLQERYPDDEACIVGWYHTHPGFGIFLSGMDLFIHQHFFTQIWHVALVLDPQATRMGFFCWNRAQTEVQPYDFPWPAWAAGGW